MPVAAFFLARVVRKGYANRAQNICECQTEISVHSGRLAQLVEHLVYTERVSGSNPLPPTIHPTKSQPSGFDDQAGVDYEYRRIKTSGTGHSR